MWWLRVMQTATVPATMRSNRRLVSSGALDAHETILRIMIFPGKPRPRAQFLLSSKSWGENWLSLTIVSTVKKTMSAGDGRLFVRPPVYDLFVSVNIHPLGKPLAFQLFHVNRSRSVRPL